MRTRGSSLMVMVLSVALCIIALTPSVFAYDFGGETVKLSFRFYGLTPLGPRNTYDWYNPDPRLQEHINNVEDMFNVDIEFVGPYMERRIGNALRTAIMAGDVLFDVGHARSADYMSLAMDGFLMPLDAFLDEEYYSQLPNVLQPGDSFKLSGVTFAFPAIPELWSSPAGLTMNKTLLQKEGVPMPYDLLEQGLWNWDVFKEILRHVTRDTDGDGKVDQWGLGLDLNGYPTFVWMILNGAEFIEEVDGRLVVNLMTDEIIETLDYLRGLQEEGLLAPTNMNVHNVAFNVDTTHFIQFSNIAANLNNYDQEWGIMPLPMGPSADRNMAVERGSVWGGVIPITTQHDPRALIELVGALMEIKEPYIGDMELWDQQFWDKRSVAVYDRQTLDMWKWQEENNNILPDPVVRGVFEDIGLFDTLMKDVILDGQSPASVLASLEPVAQMLLDELLRQ